MEFGPRALGHRSIVADPRRADDEGHPQRADQAPRAVPPVRAVGPRRTRRRLVRAGLPVAVHGARLQDRRPDKREQLPAVNHVDDTGRLQSVEARIEPRYYRLIRSSSSSTGVPMLLNTSFNENEPIVMTPRHAVDTFLEDEDGRARARELRRPAQRTLGRRCCCPHHGTTRNRGVRPAVPGGPASLRLRRRALLRRDVGSIRSDRRFTTPERVAVLSSADAPSRSSRGTGSPPVAGSSSTTTC